MPKSESTPPTVRFAHVMGFASFLHKVGAPVEPYFHRHKLPALCDDSDSYVSLLKVWAFFDDAARREDPMLGWLVGAHIGDQNLNAGLLTKLETAPTLLQALHQLANLVRLEASNRTIGIHDRSDDIMFYTHCSGLTEAPGYRIAQVYTLSVFIGLIKHFLGPDWYPSEIGLEGRCNSPGLEERFPDSRIVARQKTSYVTVPRSCLHRAPPCLNAPADETADLALSKDLDYTDTLRELLRPYLAEGYPSEHFASELMSTSVRTLTRRLSTRGLTYGKLIDNLRFQVAKDLLHEPDMRMLDIAHSVGFRDQGNFTRMFRRIGGLAPKEFRKGLN